MSGDHNEHQKDKSYLEFECPWCGRCCTDYERGFVDGMQHQMKLSVEKALDQEPVAWANSFDLKHFDMKVRTGPDLHHTVPLYTEPPKREWVGLTGDEARKFYEKYADREELIYAIDKFLEEKNT